MSLTTKQKVFVNEYLIDFNATQAAIRAGYSERTARSQGQRLLTNVDISEEIKARLRERAMDANEVIKELGDIARLDISDFFILRDGIKEPYLDLHKAKEAGLLKLIKKIKYNSNDRLELEFYDKQAALLNIGKQHGLFSDKHIVEVRLEREIDAILDIAQDVLDKESYDILLSALSADQEGGEAQEWQE